MRLISLANGAKFSLNQRKCTQFIKHEIAWTTKTGAPGVHVLMVISHEQTVKML